MLKYMCAHRKPLSLFFFRLYVTSNMSKKKKNNSNNKKPLCVSVFLSLSVCVIKQPLLRRLGRRNAGQWR